MQRFAVICLHMLVQTSIPLCPPLSVALGGSAVELYDSDSFYDDLLWAAAWMYKATGAHDLVPTGHNIVASAKQYGAEISKHVSACTQP